MADFVHCSPYTVKMSLFWYYSSIADFTASAAVFELAVVCFQQILQQQQRVGCDLMTKNLVPELILYLLGLLSKQARITLFRIHFSSLASFTVVAQDICRVNGFKM